MSRTVEIGGILYTSLAAFTAKDAPEVADEVASIPAQYWILWVLLALIILFMVTYVLRGRKKHLLYEGLAFACIVSAFALITFAITMSEPVTEYTKHHEAPVVTLIRFFVLLITSGFLVYYAVKGRHEHDGENVNV